MAAAAALLEWQPLMHLQHENYQLREENRALHWQVRELLDWKARAVRHMTALAPKRSRAQRDIRRATQLKEQLRAVESSLEERAVLEQSARALEQNERQLAQRVQELEREQQAATRDREIADTRGEALAAALQRVGDAFRVHLEKLVAVRETIDSEGGGASREQADVQVPATEDASGELAETSRAASKDETEHLDSTAIMVTGLTAVSEKCLQWFHEHVEQTFAAQQQRADCYEAQHAELELLRAEVESASQQHVESESHDHETRAQAAQLQHTNAQLTRDLAVFRTRCVEHSHSQTQLGDQVRLLVTEVRQYLRLVRVEIKKKFGYVPEAIAHAESWSRILDALDALERHVRLATVTIASPRQ